MSEKKMTDEEKTIQRQKRIKATKAINKIPVKSKSVMACTDKECPFCHRGVCTRSECFKDKDVTKRERMPREVAEGIEDMHRVTKTQCEKLVEEVAELIGLDVTQFKLYRKEQLEMQRYMTSVNKLERDHRKGQNLSKKVEDIARPEMTVTIKDCVPSPDKTAKAIKAYMTSIDFEGWREEQMQEAVRECDELRRKANMICMEMHMSMQTECDSLKKRTELECQMMKQEAEKYVQVGERIAANVDEIKRVLTGIIKEPPADVNPPKQPKKRGRPRKVDPVIEQMEAQA